MRPRSDWNLLNVYFLALMTLGYVVGEIGKFLINTTSRAVARDVHFGDLACYLNTTATAQQDIPDDDNATSCENVKDEAGCVELSPRCEWNYNGLGIEYQALSGPAFAIVFTTCCVVVGITSDRLRSRSSSFGRHRLMAFGVFFFSLCFFLTGFSNAYWQLVVLRMGIAAGEAVCRPIAGGMIADAFPPTARSISNGIFSWGIYFGYGLAYVIGIKLTSVNVLGYGWRASYVISAFPGFVIAVLLAVTLWDPASPNSWNVRQEDGDVADDERVQVVGADRQSFVDILKLTFRSFKTPEMLLLLLAAVVRQMAGLTWAFNTRTYFQTYYPTFDDALSVWLLGCSVGGGGFGVFFGGWFSDRLVKSLGMASRLWVLGGFLILSSPFAALVLYLKPPYALVVLIVYYLCGETWFAILFTVITDICHPEVKSTSIGAFLFLMNNIGGNLPVMVDPVSKAIGYRESIYLFWPGGAAVSGLLFLLASVPVRRRGRSYPD